MVKFTTDRSLPLLHAVLATALALAGPVTSAGAAVNNLRESTYRQLEKVHAFMEREDHAQALHKLDALSPKVRGMDYERAVVLQTYGYLYTDMAHYARALESIRESLALNALPREATRNLLYLSAQLRVQKADYAGAIADLVKWFAGEKSPRADAHVLAGVAYAYLGDYTAAIEHLELAMNIGSGAQEAHMRQLLAVYLQAHRYRDAAGLLQRVIIHNPGKVDDWRRLSGIYRELSDDRKALAVLDLAHRRGLLKSERDLLMLVNYYLYLDAPGEAAKLLASSLEAGTLASTGDNWELLAGAWSRSREPSRAMQALIRAAALENDPRLHLRRARLAVVTEDWGQVLEAVTAMLSSGTMEQAGEAHLLAGMAHHRRGEDSTALSDFARAEKHPESRAQARQWLDYLARIDD